MSPRLGDAIVGLKKDFAQHGAVLYTLKNPNIVIIEISHQNALWLNPFPVKSNVSQGVSLRDIVTGNPIDYKKYCRYPLLVFVHTHKLSINTIKYRTIGAIYWVPLEMIRGHMSSSI